MKVLVIDDHPVVRAGIRHIVETEPDIQVAGEAESGRAAIDESRSNGWDLIVLDFGLPDAHGLHVLKQLKDEQPERPVLVMAPRRDPELAIRAMRTGAAGYIGKDSSAEEMLAAIRTAGSTGTYINEWLAQQLSGEGRPGAGHTRLSSREQQVFLMLASGKRSKDIAAELGLSVKTVSTYRSRVLEKLKLATNAELGVYAVRHGLLEGGAPPAPDADDFAAEPPH